MSLLSDPIKAFIEICERGTVLDAASSLGITQTGVTQRIRSLEKTLGVTLFLRSSKGMRRTKEGDELYQYCQNVLKLEAESLSFLKDESIQRNVQVSFCGPTSLMRARIIPHLSTFLKSHANLVLNIKIDDFEDRVKKLKSGQVDFAFIRAEDVPNEVEGKLIAPNRFILVGPQSWKSRSLNGIVKEERIIDFDPTDDMTFNYLKKYKLLDSARKERHYVNNIESLVDMIEAGHGYGVLEEHFLVQFLNKRKITVLNERKGLENKMALCWMPRPIYSNLFQELIKSIK